MNTNERKRKILQLARLLIKRFRNSSTPPLEQQIVSLKKDLNISESEAIVIAKDSVLRD